MTTAQAQATIPPLPGSARMLATIAIAGVNFMTMLDMTVANVSLTAIAGSLGASPTQGTWVMTSFNIANAIVVPLTGWVAQRYGSVRVFLVSTLMFTLASLLCGMSTSLPMLITFRVIQGLAAGPMMPLSMGLLLQCYPQHKSGTALAAWGSTTMVAPALGPILGGYITDNFSWPWIFYINAPIGIVAIWVNWLLLRKRESARVIQSVDYVGLVLLVLWVGSLQLALDRGRELDWFNSAQIVALFATALTGFCFFLAWELSEKYPIVEIRLFFNRNFLISVIILALAASNYIAGVVLLPLWMQQTLGYSANQAGIIVSPAAGLAILIAPLIGRLVHRVDPRVLVTYAFCIFILVCFLRSGFIVDLTPGVIMLPQVLLGLGISAFFIPLTALVLAGLPPERIAAASGLSNFVRMMSAAMFTSLSVTLWENRTALHHARLIESLTVYTAPTVRALERLAGAGLDPTQSLGLLERQITVQAQTMAINDFFWLSAIGYLCLLPFLWLARPEKKPHPAESEKAAWAVE